MGREEGRISFRPFSLKVQSIPNNESLMGVDAQLRWRRPWPIERWSAFCGRKGKGEGMEGESKGGEKTSDPRLRRRAQALGDSPLPATPFPLKTPGGLSAKPTTMLVASRAFARPAG